MASLRLVGGLLVTALLVACNDAGNPAHVSRADGTAVVEYGNGVYYFDKNQVEFGNALAAFLGSHDCNVQAIASDDTSGYGYTSGYFVVCRR